MATRIPVRFAETQALAFQAASGDKNPLHVDENYAKRTPFGRRVFYGMAAVLYALGKWSEGRSFRLKNLRADFKRPLFIDETYLLEIAPGDGNRVVFNYLRGSQSRQKITVEWEAAPESQPESQVFSEGARFPRSQQEALLWASYYVGMEVPGRQALLTQVKFAFESPDPERFSAQAIDVARNEVFRHVEITGKAKGVTAFSIAAWERPEAVDFDLDRLKEKIPRSETFSGKTVFISGASRGFGSVLAQAFALQGADILLNYFKSRDEAEVLRRSIESLGRKAILCQGSFELRSDVERMSAEIRERGLKVDVMVHNAMPHLPVASVEEQLDEDVIQYVTRSLKMWVNGFYGFEGVLSPKATEVTVSSEVVALPQPKFSAYAAAKGAIEGWIKSVSAERPQRRFVILRPPRMVTDATNVVQHVESRDPCEIALALLRTIAAEPSAKSNLEILVP